jgi:hypothetical protein
MDIERNLCHFFYDKYVVIPTLEEGFFSVLTDDIRKEIWNHIKDDLTFARACRVNRRWYREMQVFWYKHCEERGFFVNLRLAMSKGKDWRWVLKTKLIIFPEDATEEIKKKKMNGPGQLKDASGLY